MDSGAGEEGSSCHKEEEVECGSSIKVGEEGGTGKKLAQRQALEIGLHCTAERPVAGSVYEF